MISLQTTEQIHNVLTWNDATIPGILIAFVLAFGSVIYYLFKTNQDMNKAHNAKIETLYQQHITEIKSFNELLVKVNNMYYDSIRNLVDLQKK